MQTKHPLIHLLMTAVLTLGLLTPLAGQTQENNAGNTTPTPQAHSESSESPPLAAPAASAAPAPVNLVEVENPYGIKALWEQGDLVSKSTLAILLIMSAASWYVIIIKLIEQSRLQGRSRKLKRDFWQQESLQQAALQLKTGSEFRFIADAGLVASAQYVGTLTQEVDRNTWLSQSISDAIDAINDRLQGGLAVLATVGSTAPFVGLFGTVWGIYHALTAIGIAGQASIDKVAGPVGEALIMTAIGLAVAVPAVLGYNWLIRRNKASLDEIRGFGTELHTVLLGGKAASTITGVH